MGGKTLPGAGGEGGPEIRNVNTDEKTRVNEGGNLMGYKMTEEQLSLRDMVRKWLQNEVEPRILEQDEKNECPLDLAEQGLEMGLHMLEIPEEYGGMGLDPRTAAIIQEEYGRVDGAFGGLFSITAMPMKCIMEIGTEEQKRYCCDALSKNKLAAFALTEPSGGSDAANMKTTAVRDGDGNYVINGTKAFITNAPYAEFFMVMAFTDKNKGHKGISAFIVESGRKGVTIGAKENKMGARLSPTAEVNFSDVVVPAANMLGKEGEGFIAAMKTLDSGRAAVAARYVGLGQRCLEESVKYAKERVAFGKPIYKHEMIQQKIADMAMRVEAGRQLVEYALDLMEAKKPYSKAVAMAKCFAADAAMFCATEAVQIHGGYGYCKEYPVEKLFRDAKLSQIVEGTQEIQRVVISKHTCAEGGMADYLLQK
jgi:butyryl-CoA dehydrogenase